MEPLTPPQVARSIALASKALEAQRPHLDTQTYDMLRHSIDVVTDYYLQTLIMRNL